MANTTPHGWTLIALFIALTFAMAKPFGAWLFALYEGRDSEISRLSRAGRARTLPRGWRRSRRRSRAGAAMRLPCWCSARSGFSSPTRSSGFRVYLPLNPQGFAGVPAPVAFNTAVSFITNTNWQSYARRIDHVEPHPDGRADDPQLPVCRDRHRDRLCAVPRLCARRRGERRSAISGPT